MDLKQLLAWSFHVTSETEECERLGFPGVFDTLGNQTVLIASPELSPRTSFGRENERRWELRCYVGSGGKMIMIDLFSEAIVGEISVQRVDRT